MSMMFSPKEIRPSENEAGGPRHWLIRDGIEITQVAVNGDNGLTVKVNGDTITKNWKLAAGLIQAKIPGASADIANSPDELTVNVSAKNSGFIFGFTSAVWDQGMNVDVNKVLIGGDEPQKDALDKLFDTLELSSSF